MTNTVGDAITKSHNLSTHQISKLRLPYLWQIPVNRQIIRISTFINYIHYDLTAYPLSFNSEGNL